MSRTEMTNRQDLTYVVLISVCVLFLSASQLRAQSLSPPAGRDLAWITESTGPRRFVSVHGLRAAIFGYSEATGGDHFASGLEAWAYPMQILTSYRVSFRQQGTTTGIDGETILRRIVYRPESVTRIYAGPDFIVREKLVVPLDEPGVIITYEVDGAHPIDIDIRFTPILDLMWPAGIGGQETRWNAKTSAYLIRELTDRFVASVGSPDVVAHDETTNAGQLVGRAPGLAFTIRAESNHKAQVIIAESGPGGDASAIAVNILENADSLEKAAADHYQDLLRRSLQIETPDSDVNRALAWSEIALDQAWVCNPDLGCGEVAGYGPSRQTRRPQYDWYFSGDGMVAIEALIAAGEYDRARQELDFIIKSQDHKTGMIWHELSQSAGLIDWSKYPYMFVHVDLTFDFLNSVGDYFAATGDRNFVMANWAAIESAYAYCQSLIDATDGLPRIPANKQGVREQDELTDELSLSASWAGAAQTFADLSAINNHPAEAAAAQEASQKAIRAIGQRYWDERRHFLITGYTRAGTPLIDRGAGPTDVRGKDLFSQAQIDSLLDQWASSDFQTDWGIRSNSSTAATYDPDSYSKGSVWAISTARVASQFWEKHRPATAEPIWNALVQWASLDSLGHIHEVTAGNLFHEQIESVPEQTWSSSGLLSAAVNGLLGIRVDGGSDHLTLAPHLPTRWNSVSLRHLRVGSSEISAKISQSATEVRLAIENAGAPVEVLFDPEIPLGAQLRAARFDNRLITATLAQNAEDTHAKMNFNVPHGTHLLVIDYDGGIALLPDTPTLITGEPSRALKIIGVNLRGDHYTVDFDYLPSANSAFTLRTPWKIERAEGAAVEMLAPDSYRLTVARAAYNSHAYKHGQVTVTLAPR